MVIKKQEEKEQLKKHQIVAKVKNSSHKRTVSSGSSKAKFNFEDCLRQEYQFQVKSDKNMREVQKDEQI